LTTKKAFITTSNGVFRIDPDTRAARKVLDRRKGFWPLRRGGKGYFGIDFHKPSGRIVVASRERLGTRRKNKPSTDMRLYAIDPDNLESEMIAEIRDVHDVHQIAISGDTLYITDCGMNRVVVYDIANAETIATINIGHVRDDINHVNAVLAIGGELLIGLNNRGQRAAEIIRVDPGKIGFGEINTLDIGSSEALDGIMHTHDIEPAGDTLLVCSSFEGNIYDARTGSMLFHVHDWARGLAVDDETVWVGSSALADRKRRHREDLDGEVTRISRRPGWKRLESYPLPSAGQVNDIILI
jgi:DNA-binding beta-propeller fold protein YncE